MRNLRWLAYTVAALAIVTASIGCSDSSVLGEISITDVTDFSSNTPIIHMNLDAANTAGCETVSLNNSGERVVAISRIVYSLPERFSISSPRVPVEIEPGESAPIEIIFHRPSDNESVSTESYRSSVQIYLAGRERPVQFVVSVGE